MQASLKMVSSNSTVPRRHKITNHVLKISVKKQKVFIYSCKKKNSKMEVRADRWFRYI